MGADADINGTMTLSLLLAYQRLNPLHIKPLIKMLLTQQGFDGPIP